MSATIAMLQPAAATPVLAGGSNFVDTENPTSTAEPFAALFQQLIGQQSVTDPSAGLLMLQGNASSTGQVSEEGKEDLAALLPFLEALGLAQPQVLPDIGTPNPNQVTPALSQATPVLSQPTPELGQATPALSQAIAALTQASAKQSDAAPITVTTIPAALSNSKPANSAGIQSQAGQFPIPQAGMNAQEPEATGLLAPANNSDGQAGASGHEAGGFKAQLESALSEAQNTNQDAVQHESIQPMTANVLKEKSIPLTQITVPQPVGSSAWDSEIGNRVVMMAGNRESHAELILTPPQMGRIEVSLTISGDQATANFASGNPTVREALESAMPRLREILADAGIQLGQAQVGAENPRQTAQQEKQGNSYASAANIDADNDSKHAESGQKPIASSLKISHGLVDVFA